MYENLILFLAVVLIIILCFFIWNKRRKRNNKNRFEQKILTLQDEINQQLQLLNNTRDTYNQEKEKLDKELEIYKDNLSHKKNEFLLLVEQECNDIAAETEIKIEELNQQKQEKQEEIDKLKSIIVAGNEAIIREREREEKESFYKLNVSDTDLEDIQKLNNLKLSFHQPIVLSKLIWTTYFQKQANDLCNRILGTDEVCGIYKITNIKTKQSYIGQSKQVSKRIKQHMKCGLGIDTPATNLLYNAMMKDGIWNFTFELLQKCTEDELNERETFYIDFFDTYNLGYNSSKGVIKTK